MNQRTAISKKLRFEVFKRDKFTCQYCGKQAPNVVLEVDHIQPVSKAGKNGILNLITSCIECNRGKTNIELDDHSALSKQRKQLELLQERRAQIELMFKWKKELEKIDDDTTDMVVSYIGNKIAGFSLNAKGASTIAALTKKYGLADILEAVDLSAIKYLRYDGEGKLTRESVEDFINKIGGILVNKRKPPVEAKLAYIKGICRNRFNYWNDQSGSIDLNEYVKALRDYGWSEERIIEDLENELIPKAKEVRNWTEWRNLIEKWTNDIRHWDKEALDEYEIGKDELDETVAALVRESRDMIPAIKYLGAVYDDFDEKNLLTYVDTTVLNYLTDLKEYYETPSQDRGAKPTYYHAAHGSGLLQMFKPIESMLTFYLDNAVDGILQQFFQKIDQYKSEHAKAEHFGYMAERYFALREDSDNTT